jgi:hypothetical protein
MSLWLFVRKILMTRCKDSQYIAVDVERAGEDEDEDDDGDVVAGRASLQDAHRKRKRKRRRKGLAAEGRVLRGLDPEDLPKRARWTIIATACLLLLMSVLLVGVTLRMAPIIDEMGESVLETGCTQRTPFGHSGP